MVGRTSRKTKQKELIAQSVEHFNSFFDAEELLITVNKKDSGIGLATVYRHLAELKKKGSLYSYLCNGRQIYSSQKKSHCHFICEETGKVMHFEIDSLDFLKDKIPGKISSFQIEIKGVCSDCTKTL